jgi:hypothetical protein
LRLPVWLKVVERSVLTPGAIAAGVMMVFQFVYGLLFMLAWIAINIPLNVLLDGHFGILQNNPPGTVPPPARPEHNHCAQSRLLPRSHLSTRLPTSPMCNRVFNRWPV